MAAADRTLFITDLDGTLLNADSMLSEFTRNTVNALVNQGIKFTYATARSLASAKVVLQGLHINMPVIVYNGVFIMNPVSEEILYTSSFDNGVCSTIENILTDSGVFPIVYSIINNKQRVSWYTDCENDGISYYIGNRQGDKRLRPLKHGDGIYKGDVFYYTCIGKREILEPVYEKMKNINGCRVTFCQELYRTEYWLEIMPAKASKAAAIQELKRIEGFDKLITFGDAANDVNMFHISDLSIAVNNAVSEAKMAADQVIESNNEDGVARWLIDYISKNPAD